MRHIISPASIPASLRQLPTAAKRQIEDSLSNDEYSSDDELVDFWSTSAGVPQDIGREAIKFRREFQMHPICVMFPEIHQ